MKKQIPISLVEGVQLKLETMVSVQEDYSCVAFIGGRLPGESKLHHWQDGVEIIYRLLKTKILLLCPENALQTDADLLEFVSALAKQNPFTQLTDELPGKWRLPWAGPLLFSSPYAETLLEKHGINSWEQPLCMPFIEELETLFEAAGVPWSEQPLIPIVQK